MRLLKGIVILMICLGLAGCSQASQVENHAYVLVMGLDQNEDGGLRMSVQVPKISGGSAQESGEKSGTGNYTSFVIEADDYEDALARLNWASPRDVTLSQIKLIVLSRELAQSPRCRDLIANIAQTERLYTAAWVAVCEGKAEDFVKAIKPNIGSHISMDIEAMFSHYTSSGYVPRSSLADLYYQTESVYSDPMVTYALLERKASPASVLSGSQREISGAYESEIETRYLGAAVFRDGSLAGVFSGTQTIMANLLRNEVDAVQYACGGQSLNLVPARATYVKVDVSREKPRISINMHLSMAAQERKPDEDLLSRSLEADILGVIRRAQELNVEPFGFAEKAARRFATIEQWQRYDWHRRFLQAEIEIQLHFSHSDA